MEEESRNAFIKSLQGAAHLVLEDKLCGHFPFSSEVGVVPFGTWGRTRTPARIAGMSGAVAVVCSVVAELRMQDANACATIRYPCTQTKQYPLSFATQHLPFSMFDVSFYSKSARRQYPYPFYRCRSRKVISANLSCPWKAPFLLVLHVFTCVFGQKCVSPSPPVLREQFSGDFFSFVPGQRATIGKAHPSN